MSDLNILLLGGGWIAEMVYVTFLNSMQKVANIHIFDLDSSSCAQRFSAYDKVKLIDEDKITEQTFDLLCILTPNYLHYEQLINFKNSSKMVLVEKPICTNVDQLLSIRDQVQSVDNAIYVSAPFRYRNDFNKLKNKVKNNDLGKIYYVSLSWFKRRGTPGSSWFTQKNLSGGGVLIDMGPHLLDLFYWLFGERKAIKYSGTQSAYFLQTGDAFANWHRAKGATLKNDVEDSMFSQLTYSDMALNLNMAWASNIENDYLHMQIFGTDATLNIYTSVGFSTNTLYKETQFVYSTAADTNIDTMDIEDRKQPFKKMLEQVVNETSPDLPNVFSSLHVMSDIFELYKNSERVMVS